MSFESIYVAGHQGLVGNAVLRNLEKNGYRNWPLDQWEFDGAPIAMMWSV